MSETPELIEDDDALGGVVPVSGLYEEWFLDYASYVILERAVPAIEDGLKPVQRRILHAMYEMDDGRFNKVANIIGQTMQYHPHGDASIGDALVNLGQKDLLIDTQGNWGDVRTGDRAAASRYIEARLSKFALETLFNPKTTTWQLSYDGRKREPVTLPVKFPLLLAQGVEGIAVGLNTKVLPHNFCELLEASIDLLKGKAVELYPDFGTGGTVDISNYQQGRRGGRVRIRAKIEEEDSKTLVIREIPYGVTTDTLIESIIKANDSGKIKIKKVTDNTAENVEIVLALTPGVSSQVTMDALYAFTDCEVSISPNACVILNDKPVFVGVDELLKYSTEYTMSLLKMELEIRLGELMESMLFSSLEKIFIENRIYRDIEECETWEAVLSTIDKGLEPFKPQFYRVINEDDIIRLTEIQIKRISKFDSFKADERIRDLNNQIEETRNHLANLTEYAISWFRGLLKKYGKGRERKTEIRLFDTIQATLVAANNVKLYMNRAEGFVGYGLKKDEFIADCSDLDEVVVFTRAGMMMVTRVAEKTFIGKDILHANIFNRNDDRMIYHMIYQDGKTGISYVKRFAVGGVTRDKEYDLTQGTKGTKVLYFSANPNGESEIVNVQLSLQTRALKLNFDYDFAQLAVKNRNAQGNIFSRYLIKKITQKSVGKSTLGGRELWIDERIGRLNTDKQGRSLGMLETEDLLLAVYSDGTYEVTNQELTNHYDPDKLIYLEKYRPETPLNTVMEQKGSDALFAKRFIIETQTVNKPFAFVPEDRGFKILLASQQPVITLEVEQKSADGKKVKRQIDYEKEAGLKTYKNVPSPIFKGKFISATWQLKPVEIPVEKPATPPKPETPTLF